MIDKKSLQAKFFNLESSLEYEITEQWLEDNVELQMKQLAKKGETEYEFVVHVSEINPSMARKVLSDKGYGVLWWPEPIDAKPPITRVRLKVLWGI